jgi:hypothetical protein
MFVLDTVFISWYHWYPSWHQVQSDGPSLVPLLFHLPHAVKYYVTMILPSTHVLIRFTQKNRTNKIMCVYTNR